MKKSILLTLSVLLAFIGTRPSYAQENIPTGETEELEASVKIEETNPILPIIEYYPEPYNPDLIARKKFQLPKKEIKGKPSHLILQPYMIDMMSGDTVQVLKPHIYDNVTKDMNIDWRDTVHSVNVDGYFIIRGKLDVFNRNNKLIYQTDTICLASTRIKSPTQFLHFDFSEVPYELDRDQYYEKPRPKRAEFSGSMSLRFLVNKAETDSKDLEGKAKLDELHTNLLNIVNNETSQLLAFNIESVSSPDGPYAKNLDLSQKRLDYIKQYLTAGIPQRALDYSSLNTKVTVASWNAVADSLENKGFAKEAAELRTIVADNENKDLQWQKARKLPYYKEKISPVLSSMRTVIYSYKYQTFKPLSTEEILAKYRDDEDYKSGKKHFEKYEYWELFRALEDEGTGEDELMDLYKRACRETEEDLGKSWIYAANKYAASCIRKGIVDVTILANHIDTYPRSNFKLRKMTGGYVLINPLPVVANQLYMHIKNGDYNAAGILAQKLPNKDEFKELKALTMCRLGYYKGGRINEKQDRQEWFEIAKESSPVNKVVMLLAMNTEDYDLLAEKAIEDLSETDALTWYFKAIISSRKMKNPDAVNNEKQNFYNALQNCFMRDPKLSGIAQCDGDIDKQMLSEFFRLYPKYYR